LIFVHVPNSYINYESIEEEEENEEEAEGKKLQMET